MTTQPLDFTNSSIEKIVNYFDMIYLFEYMINKSERKDFYCGITNNIMDNLKRHTIIGYTACVNCSSFDVSSKVEERLGQLGFDIGNPNNPSGNGGVDDSTIVYMVKKEGTFKQ